ncbi:Fc.00g082500.m01.CDS01 [Cosmosporella sp. VM-42]
MELSVKLPSDIQAKPGGQEVAEGRDFDGRLLVHFEKEQNDRSYEMKEVSLRVDLNSTSSISGYKVVGDILLDVRVISPMDTQERDFPCFLPGGLTFETRKTKVDKDSKADANNDEEKTEQALDSLSSKGSPVLKDDFQRGTEFKAVLVLCRKELDNKNALTVFAVAMVKHGELFDNMDTESSARPVLTDQIQARGELRLAGRHHKKKRQVARLRDTCPVDPELFIRDALVLIAVNPSVVHDRSKKNVKPATEMTLSSALAISQDIELAISASSGNGKLDVRWVLQSTAPAKIANGLVEGGFDGAGGSQNKPPLPDETGFGDWYDEKALACRHQAQLSLAKPVLLDGSLLVEGYDLRRIYDMVKKIYQTIREVIKSLKTLA